MGATAAARAPVGRQRPRQAGIDRPAPIRDGRVAHPSGGAHGSGTRGLVMDASATTARGRSTRSAPGVGSYNWPTTTGEGTAGRPRWGIEPAPTPSAVVRVCPTRGAMATSDGCAMDADGAVDATATGPAGLRAWRPRRWGRCRRCRRARNTASGALSRAADARCAGSAAGRARRRRERSGPWAARR